MYFVDGLVNMQDAASQVRRVGQYSTLGDALLAAQKLIDDFLIREMCPNMSDVGLFARYQMAGEVPYIFRDDGTITVNLPGFNHFHYARARCKEICSGSGLDMDHAQLAS